MSATASTLEKRATVLRAIRALFADEGFVEVETPVRVRAPGQELHIDAVPAHDRWLLTSPEYHMKRLVAAGHKRIHQIARVFRRGERGPAHLPEFTMLEWYRADSTLDRLMADCEDILAVAAGAVGRMRDEWRAPFPRAGVPDLLREHAGVDIEGDEPAPVLRSRALAAGIAVGEASAWDDIFFQIWLDRVEPALTRRGLRPIFVTDWPAPLAALARRNPARPALAERFELFAGGLELCNAFAELADPVEQRARFEEERRIRASRGKDVYPLDESLLAVLPAIEGTCGAALGFDRLLMLVLGLTEIGETVAFPEG